MPATQGVPDPTPIKTSQLKSRIMNIATPNNYLVRLAPPSAVQGFMRARGVEYSTVGEDIELRCIRTTTPGTSFLTHSVANDYQGVVEEIPYRRAYENSIEMTFIVDNNYDTFAFFEAWADYMCGIGAPITRQEYKQEAANFRMNYYEEYKTQIFLTKFEKDISNQERISDTRQNKKGLRYTFIDAYPKQINSMELNYGPAEDYLRLAVTFGYSRYISERINLK